ncbi:MAG TPA: PIN domain nuclease [Nitrospirae bacterium]|nr:PIN domain nuclease [Nitrospirota bacterium]
MVLVDTSVLIDYLRGVTNPQTEKLQHIIDQGIVFGITSLIYQEVLQGVKTEKEFKILKEYLGSQRFYYPANEKESFASAAEIYFKCRKKGITVSSSIDCLIVQIAIEKDLFLLHNDADYDRIRKVIKFKVF